MFTLVRLILNRLLHRFKDSEHPFVDCVLFNVLRYPYKDLFNRLKFSAYRLAIRCNRCTFSVFRLMIWFNLLTFSVFRKKGRPFSVIICAVCVINVRHLVPGKQWSQFW